MLCLRDFLRGKFLHDTFFEEPSFDDECDLLVTLLYQRLSKVFNGLGAAAKRLGNSSVGPTGTLSIGFQ